MQVHKSVCLHSGRYNEPWARAVYQDLSRHGYDICPMAFPPAGLTGEAATRDYFANISGRAHFVALISPSALQDTAFQDRVMEAMYGPARNLVLLTLGPFDLESPEVNAQINDYTRHHWRKWGRGMNVLPEAFDASMSQLRTTILAEPVDVVLKPLPESAVAYAERSAAVAGSGAVHPGALEAQVWFERAITADQPAERLRFLDQSLRLAPSEWRVIALRGSTRWAAGDARGAGLDFDEAVRVAPDRAKAYLHRGHLRSDVGDLDGARADYDEVLRLRPDHAVAHARRALMRRALGDLEGAISDFDALARIRGGRNWI